MKKYEKSEIHFQNEIIFGYFQKMDHYRVIAVIPALTAHTSVFQDNNGRNRIVTDTNYEAADIYMRGNGVMGQLTNYCDGIREALERSTQGLFTFRLVTHRYYRDRVVSSYKVWEINNKRDKKCISTNCPKIFAKSIAKQLLR